MTEKIKVILIGGSPMTGKSTLARELSLKFGYSYISTDDIGEIMQTVADINPMKNIDYREYYIKKNIDELITDIKEYHLKIWPGIKRLIDIHSTWSSPIIIEGWALYPKFLQSIKTGNLKSIWLIGDKELFKERLLQNENFYKGASDSNLLIDNYVKRSAWHNSKLKKDLDDIGEEYITITKGVKMQEVFEKALALINE